jgi:hypothetical protein
MSDEKLICHNCGADYEEHDHLEESRKDLDAREQVLKICPECLLRG